VTITVGRLRLRLRWRRPCQHRQLAGLTDYRWPVDRLRAPLCPQCGRRQDGLDD
jgi:hypothetical protein